MLKAIAEKLIPGIPEEARIALLQQTRLTDDDGDAKPVSKDTTGPTVLQEVIERATAKNVVEQEIRGKRDIVYSSVEAPGSQLQLSLTASTPQTPMHQFTL